MRFVKFPYLTVLSLSWVIFGVEHTFAETQIQEFFAQRKWAEAAISLKATTEKEPKNLRALFDLSSALTYLKRREEALSLLNRALLEEKGSVRRKSIEERIQVVSTLFVSHDYFQLYQDGLNLMLAKKYKQARDFFARTLLLEPGNVDILLRLGQCYILEKDFDSAAENLHIAKRLDPLRAEVRLWLGKALFERGELASAAEELKAVYPTLVKSELATNWYAEILYEMGESQAALKLVDEHLRNFYWHIPTLMSKLQLLSDSTNIQNQQLVEAKKAAQLALDQLPFYLEKGSNEDAEELGVLFMKDPDQIKADLQKKLKSINNRLAKS